MSSPAIKGQSKVRAGHRKVAKIKEEIDMRLTMHLTEAKNLVSRRWGSISAGQAIRGLAVGVLIMAGTGMYFGIIPGNQEGNPASSEGATAFPTQDRHELMAAGLEADLESYRSFLPGYVDEEGNPASSG